MSQQQPPPSPDDKYVGVFISRDYSKHDRAAVRWAQNFVSKLPKGYNLSTIRSHKAKSIVIPITSPSSSSSKHVQEIEDPLFTMDDTSVEQMKKDLQMAPKEEGSDLKIISSKLLLYNTTSPDVARDGSGGGAGGAQAPRTTRTSMKMRGKKEEEEDEKREERKKKEGLEEEEGSEPPKAPFLPPSLDVAASSSLRLDALIVVYEATAMREAATIEGLQYIAKVSRCTIVLLAGPTTPNDPNPNHPVNYVDVSMTPVDDLQALSCWGWAHNNNNNPIIKLPEGYKLCIILTPKAGRGSNFEIDFEKQGIFSFIDSRLASYKEAAKDISRKRVQLVKDARPKLDTVIIIGDGRLERGTIETQLSAAGRRSVVVAKTRQDDSTARPRPDDVSIQIDDREIKYVGVFISGDDFAALMWAKEFVTKLPEGYQLCTIRIEKAESRQVQLTEDPLFKTDGNAAQIKKEKEKCDLKNIPSKLLLAVHDDGISNDDYLVETLELAINGLPLDTLIVGYKAEAAEREWLQKIAKLSAGCSIVLAAEHTTTPPVDKYVGVFIPRDLSDNIKNDLTALSWVHKHRIKKLPKGYKFCPIFIRQNAPDIQQPGQVNIGNKGRYGDIEEVIKESIELRDDAKVEVDRFQSLTKDFVKNTHAIWYEGRGSIHAITNKVVEDLQAKLNTIVIVGGLEWLEYWETIQTRLSSAGCSVVLVKEEAALPPQPGSGSDNIGDGAGEV